MKNTRSPRISSAWLYTFAKCSCPLLGQNFYFQSPLTLSSPNLYLLQLYSHRSHLLAQRIVLKTLQLLHVHVNTMSIYATFVYWMKLVKRYNNTYKRQLEKTTRQLVDLIKDSKLGDYFARKRKERGFFAGRWCGIVYEYTHIHTLMDNKVQTVVVAVSRSNVLKDAPKKSVLCAFRRPTYSNSTNCFFAI